MKWLTPKDPAETIPITFDFSSLLTSISESSVAVTVLSGTDGSVGSMLSGAAQASGSSLIQAIQAGIAGNKYLVRALATGPEGTFVLSTVLPVDLAQNWQ